MDTSDLLHMPAFEGKGVPVFSMRGSYVLLHTHNISDGKRAKGFDEGNGQAPNGPQNLYLTIAHI